MNRKNVYIVGIALLYAVSAMADGDIKTKSNIDERQTSAVSTVTSEELERILLLILIIHYMVYYRD